MTGGPDPTAPARQLLSFSIDGEEYALDLSYVREIVRYESATRVPRMAACVRGVVNLRGDVLPVIDLAVGLGLPATEVTPQSCVLVVELVLGGERTVVGLLADAVNRVLDLAPEDIEPSPPFGTRAPAALVLGTARVDGRFVLLLDVDRLFADATFRRDPSGGRPASAILQHHGERS